MRLSFVFVLLSFCITNMLNAQEYKAFLVDAESHQGVAYANVGIIDAEIGTNTDSTGFFSLQIPNDLADKKMLFSLIGYKDNKLTVKDFLAMQQAGKDTVFLIKDKTILEEVVVRPAKYEQQVLGNNIVCLTDPDAKKQLPIPFLFESKRKGQKVTDTLTEIGTLMKVKRKKTFIDSVQINVGRCSYPEILYRLNIYEDISGTYKNILPEPIYIKMKAEDVKSKIVIDLSQQNLVVQNNFVVAIERVKDLGKGEFAICGNMSLAAPMLMRVTSIGQDFVKLPIIGMGMQAYVTVERH